MLLVILFFLFLQMLVGGGFTIRSFLEQTRNASSAELFSDWRRARSYLERLKHHHLIILANLKNLPRLDSLLPTLRALKDLEEIDRVVVLDEDRRPLAEFSSGRITDLPGLTEILGSYRYSYPSNRFFYHESKEGAQSLYLITGARLSGLQERRGRYSVYLIKGLDNGAMASLYQELGMDLALFVGDRYISSSIPHFRIPHGTLFNTVQSVSTSTGRYHLLAGVLSSDLQDKVHLLVLRSVLNDRLNAARLIKSLLLAFLTTLAISAILAVSITAYFTAPFGKLQKWLDRYQKSGRLAPLEINTRDEIGFLTQTFHAMAKKLIREEALIKKQLQEISFLHRYNDNILKNLQAGVLVINALGLIEYCNDYLCRLCEERRDRIMDLKIHDFLSARFRISGDGDSLEELDIKRGGRIDNLIFRESNGEKRSFIAKVIPLGASGQEARTLMVLEDITKTERLWEKMMQAEKITALGLLSAGMAHEINNPLGSILSHVQYLAAVEQSRERLDSLKWIESETRRIAEIVERLLNFARSEDGKEGIQGRCSLNQALSETVGLLQMGLKGKQIRVSGSYAPALPPVSLGSGTLKQVLLNLLINAIQAVGSKGRIDIATGRSSQWIELVIRDSGSGIPKEDQDRIFDPFFTTKKSGSGTGLGLSICYSIISKAGGEIRVRSNGQGGTAVTVLLPRAGDLPP